MPRFRSDVPKNLFRIPITITSEMEKWFQKLSTTMKSTGGYKMPRSYIIRAFLDAVMTLNIDVSGVKTQEELKKRILEAIKHGE